MYSIVFSIVKCFYLIPSRRGSNIFFPMDTKNEQIGFRLSANLKRELQDVAKREGRTLSQICEMFVAGGLESYRKEGVKYLQLLLTRLRKESSE